MKIKLNKLLIFVIMFVCSFAVVGEVNAATKVTGYSAYSGTVAHHRVITGGKNAWCINMNLNGPTKGNTITKKNTYTKGYYIYILNHGNPTSNKKADVLEIQNALWMYRHWAGASHSPSVPSSYSYYSAGKKLWNAAKKAGSSYTYKPKISITSNPGTLKYSNGYYTSSTVKVSLSDTASKTYTVKLTGSVPSGAAIYDTSGKKLGTSGSKISASSFVIKVPAANVTKAFSFKVNVTAPSTKYVNKAITYNSGSNKQDLLSYETATSAPSVGASASVTPIGLKIIKQDADDTKVKLAGAKYRIFTNSDCTGDVSGFTGTYTTGADGSITITGLPAKTYYVKEVAPPPGYAPAAQACKSATVSNTVGSVTFSNKKNFAEVFKQDTAGKNLPGATFGLYTNATCTTRAVSALTGKAFPISNTDSNGKVSFYGLDSSQTYYYVKEETPPTGYALPADNCKGVAINGTVTFEDLEIGDLQVQKRDSFTNMGIDGVEIGLYTDEDCTQLQQKKTTKNGVVSFSVDYTIDGSTKYYVQEISVPDGYIPAKGKGQTECIEVSVPTQHSVVIQNTPYGDIKLLKTDVATGQPIAGVEFALLDENKKEVTDVNGNKVANQKTNEQGILEFKDVKYGTYYIKEVNTGGKYKLIKDPIKFVLNSSTDAVKLATRGSVYYNLGDLNADRHIDEADLVIYQTIIDSPDLGLGLPPETIYAMDVNRDGNNGETDADRRALIMKDMEIVDYYVKLTGDKTTLTASRNYAPYKNSYCSATGDSECNLNNLQDILDLYNDNKQVLASYSSAQAAADSAAQTANQQAQEEYEAAEAAYEARCPQREHTPLNSGGNLQSTGIGMNDLNQHMKYLSDIIPDGDLDGDGNGDGGSGTDPNPTDPTDPTDPDDPTPDEPTEPTYDPECQNPPVLEVVEPQDVCPNYDIVGDINHDCILNQSDVEGIISTDVDLNGDGEINNVDKSILSRYVSYIAPGKSTETIFSSMQTFISNRTIMCTALGDASCAISDEQLEYALTTVGKAGTLPSSIAGSSLYVTDEVITMKISKEIISKSVEIPGAKIVIRDDKNNKFLEFTSGKTPKEFEIPAGVYTLTEKVAPKGYKTLTTVIKFQVMDDGSVKLLGATSNLYKIKKGTDNHLIIYNEPVKPEKIVIPDTGSNVNILTIIAGILLISGGGYVIFKRSH